MCKSNAFITFLTNYDKFCQYKVNLNVKIGEISMHNEIYYKSCGKAKKTPKIQ